MKIAIKAKQLVDEEEQYMSTFHVINVLEDFNIDDMKMLEVIKPLFVTLIKRKRFGSYTLFILQHLKPQSLGLEPTRKSY
jgi:hypothetical protein